MRARACLHLSLSAWSGDFQLCQLTQRCYVVRCIISSARLAGHVLSGLELASCIGHLLLRQWLRSQICTEQLQGKVAWNMQGMGHKGFRPKQGAHDTL